MECHVVVRKDFPCGHVTEKPCVELSEGYQCQEPCITILECLHPCPGNCSDCRQGRMHVPCQEPCERKRVCQHLCAEPCTKNCPPCTEPCGNRCLHSKCPKLCREPCAPCKVSNVIRWCHYASIFVSLDIAIDVCHGTAALLKFDQTIIGKNKPSSVSAPIFRVTDQSTVKCHHFENCNFYKDLYGERARLAHSAHLPYKTL